MLAKSKIRMPVQVGKTTTGQLVTYVEKVGGKGCLESP